MAETKKLITGKVIDLHSHLYPPRYMDLLRRRTEGPMVVARGGQEYLAVLPGKDDRGDVGRLFGLGLLPATAGATACVTELEHIAALPHLRGIILSTQGLGRGLDDPDLEPVWAALAAHRLTPFIHPHTGIGQEHYAAYGYVLYLALGFTFATTIEVAKMALAGVLQRHPGLQLLLAHGGGTLPFLAGRIDACLSHDEELGAEQRALAPGAALRGLVYDAITYSAAALRLVVDFAGPGKVVFGTDHPFSIAEAATVLATIDEVAASEPLRAGLRGDNAARLLSLRH